MLSSASATARQAQSRWGKGTKAASKPTYYTIRFLVDRFRIEDADRANAYFHCVGDILGADPDSMAWSDEDGSSRLVARLIQAE